MSPGRIGHGRDRRRGEEGEGVSGDSAAVVVVVGHAVVVEKDAAAKGDGLRRIEMILGVRSCRAGRDLRPKSWIRRCLIDDSVCNEGEKWKMANS